MKGMHGVRIRPGSSLIELRVRLHNRTEDTQTFLWWANVAARAHDRYQSFFPTDVHYVADHARRAVTGFPRADRPYYGVDYPSRVDEQHPDADRLDFYGNIPVPTSYMVLETEDDFFGGYDHEVGAGFVHWADRRIAPGKKQWTWGNAPFGHAWDQHLTDQDGPYVELMAGVYTDNQPDFSYLAPGETKTFSQYWYPITGIGPAHQATKQAAVSLSVEAGEAAIGVSVTGIHSAVTVRLTRTVGIEGAPSSVPQTVFERVTPLAPGAPLLVPVPADTVLSELLLSVETESVMLVSWRPRAADHDSAEPAVATEPLLPGDIESADELYLTGVHLQQYRHPTRSAQPYFSEILRRDAGDARANVALGAWEYRRGDFDRAHTHFSAAIARLTHRNPNPADGEAHYRLGLTLARLGRPEAAYDAFAKAAWDVRWSHPAELRMAVLDAAASRDEQSLGRLVAAERHDSDDLKMRALRVVVLDRLGRSAESRAALERTLELDPLDVLARTLVGEPPADALLLFDASMDFAEFGETDLALELLAAAAVAPPTSAGGIAPVAEYAAARILDLCGRADEARDARIRARSASPEYCFPSGLDAYEALRAALRADPEDARALALLGMWLYSADRHEEALEAWTAALEKDTSDPVLMRNTAVALVNHRGDDDAAASAAAE
jgi:tetratricopeptide (TPR) repeat protein